MKFLVTYIENRKFRKEVSVVVEAKDSQGAMDMVIKNHPSAIIIKAVSN